MRVQKQEPWRQTGLLDNHESTLAWMWPSVLSETSMQASDLLATVSCQPEDRRTTHSTPLSLNGESLGASATNPRLWESNTL